jgi:hypothetical protein
MSALYSVFEHDPKKVGTGFPKRSCPGNMALRQFDKRATGPY